MGLKGEVQRATVLKGGKDSRKGYGGNERGREANIGWMDRSLQGSLFIRPSLEPWGGGARASVKMSEQARSGPEV